MIEIGSDAALLVLGAAISTVAAWGSSISIRSASRGPRWALDHLGSIRPLVLGGVLVGIVLTLLVRPVWTGLAVSYVAITVLLLAALLRRALTRLDEHGGLEELPIERRRQIVARARRMILGAGVILAAIGVGGVAAGVGAVGWIPLVLGATLVITALVLSADPG